MKKTILITGGAGFIGANFIPYFLGKYGDYSVVNLDKLTYAGNLENLKEVQENPRHKFILGDICNRTLVEKIFSENKIEGVIHFAAESHVDNSITDPEAFIQTNVTGTFTLIDVTRMYWQGKPFRFHHISTDEVYGPIEIGNFIETDRYAPSSPYSASKAGSDLIVRSYYQTYGMNVVLTHCSNNYGPKQHGEKLIPAIIKNALAGEKIPVYGEGRNIRNWLYVEDHCKAIDLAFHNGVKGESYNIAGPDEKINLELVKQVCLILDQEKPRTDRKSYTEQIQFVIDRLGHDYRYGIDTNKIQSQLGWKAEQKFETGILKTVRWYL